MSVPMLPDPSALPFNGKGIADHHSSLEMTNLGVNLPTFQPAQGQASCPLPGVNAILSGQDWDYPSPRSSASPCPTAPPSPAPMQNTARERLAMFSGHLEHRGLRAASAQSNTPKPFKTRIVKWFVHDNKKAKKEVERNPKAKRELSSRLEHCRSMSALQNQILKIHPEKEEFWTPLKSNNISDEVPWALHYNKKDVLDAATNLIRTQHAEIKQLRATLDHVTYNLNMPDANMDIAIKEEYQSF